MALVSNMMMSAIIAPICVTLSALSLTALQRALEWIAAAAKSPPKQLKQLKPYLKIADKFMEKIFKLRLLER